MFFSLPDFQGIPLDKKLDEIFGKKEKGIFIELGANDGLTQSNTAFFEYFRGWRGLLIEPSLQRYKECARNRPNSICVNGACVSKSYTSNTISGDFNGNLMSSVGGIRTESQHKPLTEVAAFTLENLLDKCSFPSIDFLSLDTEGYELEVLNGLNLEKYRPKYMLIEIYNKDYESIVAFLRKNKYKLLQNFSGYNRLTNPIWDGTHNDFLFIDEN
jgi:FkbM family methyltransferase